jgi:integrase
VETPRHFRAKGRPGGKPLYYWQPSPKLRALGFGERRLADELARALVECEAFNREADEYRHKAARGVFADAPAGSIRALVAHYKSHDDYLLLAPKTRREYARCLDLIRMKMGDVAVKQVTPAIVQALKRAFAPTPVQANHVLRTLRLLMSFARREGMVQHNPVSHFRQYRERPRQQVWSDTDERRFLAVCGPELALVYLIAVYTAQRQADVLALPWSAYDGHSISLRQAKTTKRVDLLVAARLRRLLEETPRVSPIICTTASGRPWKADNLRHRFAAAMKRAGLAGLRFQDLRRTAIVRMAEAGCTVPEIASVSGHQIDTCQRIIDVYLPATRLLAHSAIIKLDAHRPRD